MHKKSKTISKIEMLSNDRLLDNQSWKIKGLLFGLMLTITCIPLSAQNNETTTTTTTKSVAVPVVQVPAVTESVSTTTKTFAKTRTLYLRTSYHGAIKNSSHVFIRPNGRIYDEDGDYVGHLTDLNGDDLKSIPDDHRYKIRNLKGTVIASTKLTDDFDSDRTVTLARQDTTGHLIVETTETTSVTSAPVAPVVVATPVQSTTTTTTSATPVNNP